ncbi:MAG: UvrD-helicase domain-containing protein [Propionibacteriaceae bacterium]|nr:UvrD-helicase domain-containing protein [Propionibacteriaceae bacterium]
MTGFMVEHSARPVAAAPVLDSDQHAVVEHAGGPLLVLAGPGTGTTTTLVEAAVRRIRAGRASGSPRSPLVLTFSRRAAAGLRMRIAARLGHSTATPLAMTYHAFCFALLRRFSTLVEEGPGWRVLTAPEQEFRVRETLAGLDPESHPWPDSVAGALGTRAFAGEIRAVLARTRQLGLDPEDLVDLAREAGRPEWAGVGRFMAEYLDVLDFEQVLDYPELVHRCRILLTEPGVRELLRADFDGFLLDEYQDTDVAQAQLVAELAGPGGDVIAFGDPDQSIYGFRGAESRGIFDFPELFRTATGDAAPIRALGPRAGSGPGSRTRRDGWRSDCRWPGRWHPRCAPPSGPPSRTRPPGGGGSRCACTSRPVRRRSTSPTCCARHICARGSRGGRWRCWCARADATCPGWPGP